VSKVSRKSSQSCIGWMFEKSLFDDDFMDCRIWLSMGSRGIEILFGRFGLRYIAELVVALCSELRDWVLIEVEIKVR
jgi:hypothetical protein